MAHLTALLFLALACISAVFGTISFKVSDCARDKANELLTVINPRVEPHPIPIPGNIRVSGTLVLKHDVHSGLNVHLSVKRKLGFIWIPVPCISHVGSCTYNNVCGMLGSFGGSCPQQVTDTGLRCHCPIYNGTYTVNNLQVAVPKLSGALATLAKGDYKVDVSVRDGNEEVACQHVEVSLGSRCHGFLCGIIG